MSAEMQAGQAIQRSGRGLIPFDERLTCSVAEACEAVGLSRAKIYQLISGGAVETVTIGRRRLVRVPSLKRLIDESAT